MSRLPLAALLLLLAAPGRADNAGDQLKRQAGPDADPSKIKVAEAKPAAVLFKDCTPEQDKRVRSGIDDALEMVKTCLSKYNKGEMASKIRKQFKSFVFSCNPEEAAHGGITAHDGGKAYIKMTMRSRLVQYPMSARVFHEMIHAVDTPSQDPAAKQNRDGRYIISQERHNRLAFPDAVYGCQFACYGGVYDDERKGMDRYNKELTDAGGNEIPLLDDARAKELGLKCQDGENCGQRFEFAWLCDQGRPFAPKDVLAKARKADAPKCIAEKMINGCDAIDDVKQCPSRKAQGPLCAAKCEIIQAAGGGYGNGVIDKYMGIGRKFADAYPKGPPADDEDRPLYDAAKKKNLLKACLE